MADFASCLEAMAKVSEAQEAQQDTIRIHAMQLEMQQQQMAQMAEEQRVLRRRVDSQQEVIIAWEWWFHWFCTGERPPQDPNRPAARGTLGQALARSGPASSSGASGAQANWQHGWQGGGSRQQWPGGSWQHGGGGGSGQHGWQGGGGGSGLLKRMRQAQGQS